MKGLTALLRRSRDSLVQTSHLIFRYFACIKDSGKKGCGPEGGKVDEFQTEFFVGGIKPMDQLINTVGLNFEGEKRFLNHPKALCQYLVIFLATTQSFLGQLV